MEKCTFCSQKINRLIFDKAEEMTKKPDDLFIGLYLNGRDMIYEAMIPSQNISVAEKYIISFCPMCGRELEREAQHEGN